MFNFLDRKKGNLFILNKKGEPEACPSPSVWGKWMEENGPNHLLAHTQVANYQVLTVFTGENLSPDLTRPRLWATNIFPLLQPNGFDSSERTYATADEALEDHAEIVSGLVSQLRSEVRSEGIQPIDLMQKGQSEK